MLEAAARADQLLETGGVVAVALHEEHGSLPNIAIGDHARLLDGCCRRMGGTGFLVRFLADVEDRSDSENRRDYDDDLNGVGDELPIIAGTAAPAAGSPPSPQRRPCERCPSPRPA
jgi:hypothetical protein